MWYGGGGFKRKGDLLVYFEACGSFSTQIMSVPSHIFIRVLLASHIRLPGKPDQQNKHLRCQLCFEESEIVLSFAFP